MAGVLQGRGTAAAQSCLLATSRLKAAVAAAACPQPYELPDLLSSACAGAALESLDSQQSSDPAGSATAAAALLTPRHIALSSSGTPCYYTGTDLPLVDWQHMRPLNKGTQEGRNDHGTLWAAPPADRCRLCQVNDSTVCHSGGVACHCAGQLAADPLAWKMQQQARHCSMLIWSHIVQGWCTMPDASTWVIHQGSCTSCDSPDKARVQAPPMPPLLSLMPQGRLSTK